MQRQNKPVEPVEEKHVQLTPNAVMKIKKEVLAVVNDKDNKSAIVKSIEDVPACVSKLKAYVPLCMGYKGSPSASLLRDYHQSLVKELREIMQGSTVEIQFFVHFPTRQEADDFLNENEDLRAFCMPIEDFRDTQKWQSLNQSREKLSAKYPKDWTEKRDKTCADYEKKVTAQGVKYVKKESEIYFGDIACDWAAMMPSEQGEVSIIFSDRHHDQLPVWKFINRHAHEMRWKTPEDCRGSTDLSNLSDASSMSSDDSTSIGNDSEGTGRIFKDSFRYVQFTCEAVSQLQQKPVSPTLEARSPRAPSAPVGSKSPTSAHTFKLFAAAPQKSFVPAPRPSNDSGYLSTSSSSSSSGSNPSSDDEAMGIIAENFGFAIAAMARHASVEKAAELYHESCKLVSSARVSSSSMFQHPNPAINAGFVHARTTSTPASPSSSPPK